MNRDSLEALHKSKPACRGGEEEAKGKKSILKTSVNLEGATAKKKKIICHLWEEDETHQYLPFTQKSSYVVFCWC